MSRRYQGRGHSLCNNCSLSNKRRQGSGQLTVWWAALNCEQLESQDLACTSSPLLPSSQLVSKSCPVYNLSHEIKPGIEKKKQDKLFNQKQFWGGVKLSAAFLLLFTFLDTLAIFDGKGRGLTEGGHHVSAPVSSSKKDMQSVLPFLYYRRPMLLPNTCLTK